MSDPEPRRVEKPWGYEVWWAQTDAYAGKLLYVESGHRLSLQLHRQKDESSYVLSGRLLLTRGHSAEELEQVEIGPGFSWRIEPGTVHSIEAIEDAVVLEVRPRIWTMSCGCRIATGARIWSRRRRLTPNLRSRCPSPSSPSGSPSVC